MNKYRLIQIISGIVFFCSLSYLVYTDYQYKSAESGYSDLLQYVSGYDEEENSEEQTETDMEPYLQVDYEELKKINDDYCFWLSACGNEISYPVVKGVDNEEYLHKTFNNKSNFAGCIFMDYRCSTDLSDFHTVIYGHSMKDWSMFRRLLQYTDSAYEKEYPCFYIYTKEGRLRYDIFAVCLTDGNDVITAIDNDDPQYKQKFVDLLKEKSIYNIDIQPSVQDNIISLVTCDVRDDSRRLAVYGVLDDK